MIRIILCSFIALAGSFMLPAALYAQTPQYVITAPQGPLNPQPFFNNVTANKSQAIYHSEDFATAKSGMMTAIYVQVSFIPSGNTGTPTYHNFTVKMKQYQPDTLNSPPAAPAKPWVTGLTTVFSAANWTLSGPVTVGQWIKIPLQTPFPFSKEINLLVEMSQGPDTPSNAFGIKCYAPAHQYSRLIGSVSSPMSNPGSIVSTPIIGFDLASTAVGGVNGNEQISVYPNPAANSLHIADAPANSKYTIADITGKALLSGKRTAEPIDIGSLSAGMYLLRVECEGKAIEAVRFMKE